MNTYWIISQELLGISLYLTYLLKKSASNRINYQLQFRKTFVIVHLSFYIKDSKYTSGTVITRKQQWNWKTTLYHYLTVFDLVLNFY